ncbi:restriction endonuclease fold toxin 5 domain-containing protein [Burkholderia vietnamiensis]|uniref:restriction endonuclease fold toxin 5 domain-containing protein n=1 Tax=Burkholderia vietnamiensis TaxID=60552 RepID=UPI001B9D43DE|nr:restriction endonuclease fold toxin 5 domain-containing protein [Burkholderia vietnamiensis]MBR8032818.1 restriction endonuclease fold toxin 5 domain-containing protein [Burkholderia vietnamiensis]
MGIPFPPVLGSAANAMAQVPVPVSVPVPTPAPTAGAPSGSGAGADGGWGSLPRDRSRERDRPCKCPPEKGRPEPANHSMSELSAEYQQYITNFPRGVEWLFAYTEFDGFDKAQCLLQEAKAKYDQFFNPKTGKPKFFFLIGKSEKTVGAPQKISGWKKMLDQATRQSDIVRENAPAKMKWYFMQPLLFGYATSEFAKRGLFISTEHRPMPGMVGDK